MELIQKEDLRELLHELWRVSLDINRIKELYRPILDGEHLMSSEEVCDALKITKRTLQQYRDDGMLSYVALPGKMLYKESDILALLQRNYIPAYKHYETQKSLSLGL